MKVVSAAQRLFDAYLEHEVAQDAVMEVLQRAGLGDFLDDWHHDYYDTSIEFTNCPDDLRLTAEQQRAIWGMGFELCWLNHRDGWETFYSKRGTESGRIEGSRKFDPRKQPSTDPPPAPPRSTALEK